VLFEKEGRRMKIRTEEDLFNTIFKKIVKSRKKAIRRIRSAFPGSPKSIFLPLEVERSAVTRVSLVPFVAFNSVISLNDVRKLNGKNPEKLDKEYKEGETTVADIISFFFPRKKKKKKRH
jgi:hypothetical protein